MKQKRKGIILLFILGLTINCHKEKTQVINKQDQLNPKWKDSNSIRINKVLSIGSDNLSNKNEIFGDIGDLATDKEDNVSILDEINFKIFKFNSSGEFVMCFGGKGQGPGEFQRPQNVCVGDNGNVYVSDYVQRRINIFNNDGKFINSFFTENKSIPLNDILAYNDKYLFVGTDPRHFYSDWKDGIFLKYSISDGKYIGVIGTAKWIKKNLGVFAAADSICLDKKNNVILVVHTNPYLIEKFSIEGKLLEQYGRKAESFEIKLDEPDHKDIKIYDGASLCAVCFPDGKLLNVIRHIPRFYKEAPYFEIERYFDFFDEDGNYLITIPEERFGVGGKYNVRVKTDTKGYLWISFLEPYPHITKYKIDFME